MSSALKLLKMIQKEVLPDIEEHMDEMFAVVADKNSTQEDKDELKETQQLHQDFKQILQELEENELEEDEILEWIEAIEEMKNFSEEDME
jgi:thioester reductase-like protein